jgi:hypothetical protein
MMVGGTHEGRTSKRDAKDGLGMFYSLLRIHVNRGDVCFVSPCVCSVKSKMLKSPNWFLSYFRSVTGSSDVG